MQGTRHPTVSSGLGITDGSRPGVALATRGDRGWTEGALAPEGALGRSCGMARAVGSSGDVMGCFGTARIEGVGIRRWDARARRGGGWSPSGDGRTPPAEGRFPREAEHRRGERRASSRKWRATWPAWNLWMKGRSRHSGGSSEPTAEAQPGRDGSWSCRRCRSEGGNVRRALAVVTRYGCWRGECFEGCGRAAGNLRRLSRVMPRCHQGGRGG